MAVLLPGQLNISSNSSLTRKSYQSSTIATPFSNQRTLATLYSLAKHLCNLAYNTRLSGSLLALAHPLHLLMLLNWGRLNEGNSFSRCGSWQTRRAAEFSSPSQDIPQLSNFACSHFPASARRFAGFGINPLVVSSYRVLILRLFL